MVDLIKVNFAFLIAINVHRGDYAPQHNDFHCRLLSKNVRGYVKYYDIQYKLVSLYL